MTVVQESFGEYGGRYVPETLIPALDELTSAWEEAKRDPAFRDELHELGRTYVGRPSPITRADRFAPGKRLYLKREDLNHTGAHKINNALGQALRRAVDSWDSDKTVAIVASGGLSHTIMDEGIDRMTLDAVMEKDAEALWTLPHERLNLGTSEIRNWIAVAGAMEPETPHQIGEYIPAYRSPAGAGCGIAFTYWQD